MVTDTLAVVGRRQLESAAAAGVLAVGCCCQASAAAAAPLAEVETDLQAAMAMPATAQCTEDPAVVAAMLVVSHPIGSSVVAAPLQSFAHSSCMGFS